MSKYVERDVVESLKPIEICNQEYSRFEVTLVSEVESLDGKRPMYVVKTLDEHEYRHVFWGNEIKLSKPEKSGAFKVGDTVVARPLEECVGVLSNKEMKYASEYSSTMTVTKDEDEHGHVLCDHASFSTDGWYFDARDLELILTADQRKDLEHELYPKELLDSEPENPMKPEELEEYVRKDIEQQEEFRRLNSANKHLGSEFEVESRRLLFSVWDGKLDDTAYEVEEMSEEQHGGYSLLYSNLGWREHVVGKEAGRIVNNGDGFDVKLGEKDYHFDYDKFSLLLTLAKLIGESVDYRLFKDVTEEEA